MIPRSGDKDFDYALAQTLAKISTAFDVLPGFAYYDDYDGKNAYATPTARLSRADGTVLFGQGMLTELRASPDHPEIAVTAVCAHEFGHILQYKNNLMDQLISSRDTLPVFARRSEHLLPRQLSQPRKPDSVTLRLTTKGTTAQMKSVERPS
jgi:hypothetical protein